MRLHYNRWGFVSEANFTSKLCHTILCEPLYFCHLSVFSFTNGAFKRLHLQVNSSLAHETLTSRMLLGLSCFEDLAFGLLSRHRCDPSGPSYLLAFSTQVDALHFKNDCRDILFWLGFYSILIFSLFVDSWLIWILEPFLLISRFLLIFSYIKNFHLWVNWY